MKTMKNILIIRTDRIGDVILTLPLASIIKKHLPEAKVSFLIREYTAPLLKNHPDIDNILILKENGKLLEENLPQIKRGKFDAAIAVYPTSKIAFLLYRAGINIRIGSGYRLYSLLFNKRVFTHRKSGLKHELEYNVELLEKIGISEKIDIDSVPFNIHIDEDSIQSVLNKLKNHDFSFAKKTVIIHPGSGGSAVNLPNSHFSELLQKAAQELCVNMVVTGSEAEKEMTSEIIGNVHNCIDLSGKLSLSELTVLISLSNVLIANSTGPIHIAAALKKFVIGFYPKVHSMSPKRWGPYTNKRAIFLPEIKCDNCTVKQCEQLNCMSSIDIQKVFEKLKEKLEKLEIS